MLHNIEFILYKVLFLLMDLILINFVLCRLDKSTGKGKNYKTALKSFRQELRQTRGLFQALQDVGYKDSQRILNKRQLDIIEDYLGEPWRTQNINPQTLAITGVPADCVLYAISKVSQ